MNGKIKFGSRGCLVISLLFTVVCMSMSAGILRDWGNIKISHIQLETDSGHQLAARVYKPKSATSENPAPTVIFNHGLTVNKESYAQFGMELARRGFVVITPDMLNHGDSEVTDASVFLGPFTMNDAYGTYAAVRYAKTLDYVDDSQLGVAGHSAGGLAANNSILLDNMEEDPSISAIYLVASDPLTTDSDGNWTNIYGMRDFGVYYTIYDHVYFNGIDAEGNRMKAQDWLSSENAKSLFAFGRNPSEFEGNSVIPGHTYMEEVDGTQAFRRVNAAREIHPKPQGGANALAAVCDFFQDSFEAPSYIVGQSQNYSWLTIFNLMGLIGILATCVFSVSCLTKLKFFASLSAEENMQLRPAPEKKGRIWFWVLTILNCVFAFISISLIFFLGFGYSCFPFLPQQPSNIYAFWALLNGLFMLATSFASYRLYARKNGATMVNWGLKISLPNFVKSILLALCACGTVFILVGIANRIFSVDFRYYLWGLKNIPLKNIGIFFAYLPFYLIFGLAVSIALNSAYHCKIGKEPECINDLFFALMNAIPALVITAIGFYLYARDGIKPFIFGSTYTFTYTINSIPVFPIAVILIRRLFKKCNNPYVPGIVTGVLLCWLQVSCSFTVRALMYYGPGAAYLP